MFRRSRSKPVLRLSAWTFRIWWLCVVASQCLLGVFYRHLYLSHQTAGVITHYVDAGLTPDSGLTYGRRLDDLTPAGGGLDAPTSGGTVDGSTTHGELDPSAPQAGFGVEWEDPRRFIVFIAYIYAVIAAGHALEVFLACILSLHYRQLCFQAPEGSFSVLDSVRVFTSHFGSSSGGTSSCGGILWQRCITKPLAPVKRWVRRLNYILDSYSTTVVLVLEAVEVGCQTAQAYRMSYNVSVVWMNRLYALATVGNCWSSPCLHLMFRRHPTTERVVAMMIGTLLSAFQSVVIPWMILYPGFENSISESAMISGTPYYSNVAYADAEDNIQQLYPASWLNVFIIGAPAFFMLRYISSIKRSVLRCTVSVSPISLMVRGVQQAINTSEKETASSDDLVPVGPTAPARTRKSGSKASRGRKSRWISRILHSWLGIWGFVMLACHLYAVRKGNQAVQAGCMNLMRPWLTTEYACSLANISCAMKHITGHQDELQEILGNMATNELQELIISDCIELEMPPRLQAFPNLTRVVIYNSSIASWEMDAALTADHHAKLASLSIIETNMSAVPPALLHSNLPPTLSNLAFSGTNLTTLPDNAHEYWTMVNLLCLEVSPGVTEVPSTFRLLPQIVQISLVGNSISVLPDDWFTGDTFMIIFLDLNGNPLTSLPSAFSPDHFPLINIKGSLIEYLPDAWMDIPEIAPTISAGGTRLCAHLAANESVFAAENSIVPFMDEFQTYMVQSIKVRCPSDSIGMRWFGNPPGTLVNFAW